MAHQIQAARAKSIYFTATTFLLCFLANLMFLKNFGSTWKDMVGENV